MLAMYFVAIGLSILGLLYLAQGGLNNFHSEMNAQASLLLLLIIFSIIVFHINSMVLIEKIIDTIMLVWFLAILVMYLAPYCLSSAVAVGLMLRIHTLYK